MADDEQTVQDEPTTEPADPTGPATPRSGSAAAQAASRARRMGGGRPTPVGRRPRPGPAESDPDGGTEADTAATTGTETSARTEAPASTEKPARTETSASTEKPARTDTSARTDPEATATGTASRPTTRTRVAGRRPSPGPRTEDEDDTDATAPTRTRGSGARATQAPPAAAKRSGPAWRRWLPAGVAAALVVALAIVDVLLFWDWRHQPGKAERREQLIASVNAGVTRLLSYDYRHLDQDETTASARLTGKFRDDYIKSMDTTIKKSAPTEKAVVVGEVSSTAISSTSGDGKQAVLLVLGQQTITNVKQTTPRNELVQLRVTAQLVHGKWLVSNLATL